VRERREREGREKGERRESEEREKEKVFVCILERERENNKCDNGWRERESVAVLEVCEQQDKGEKGRKKEGVRDRGGDTRVSVL
jgi:hypothetical protein